MILTDREIQIAIERRLITVDPPPVDRAFSSTSLDLTLDENIRRFKKDKSYLARTIEPTHPAYTIDEALEELTEGHVIDAMDGFVLSPNELILGWTREYINLFTSTRIAARIEGKSSFARIGLAIHMTAPTIHAGFEGQIQLEIINHGLHKILLKPNMRICQLIFEQTLGTPDRGYEGQFSGQKAGGPLGAD
jgi:dCTP deaminase